jgi:anti-sigma B factor antagonist
VKIRTESKEGIVTVTVEGEVDSAERERVGKTIQGLLEGGASRFVFDFEKVTFVGSAGIGCLIEARKEALARKGGVALVKPARMLRKVIHDMGFDSHFPVYATVEDAARALTGPPPSGSSPPPR